MSHNIEQALLDDYAAYFSVQQDFSLNVVPVNQLPDATQFETAIPELFRMASDMLVVDQQALRDLNMGERSAKLIASVLQQQAQRISMLSTYLLRQEDDPAHRCEGLTYSGGGCSFTNTKAALQLAQGDWVQVKLFLPEDLAAVCAWGQIIALDSATTAPTDEPNPAQITYTVAFNRIREADRELLVKASLQTQTKQLRARSMARQQAQENNEPE